MSQPTFQRLVEYPNTQTDQAELDEALRDAVIRTINSMTSSVESDDTRPRGLSVLVDDPKSNAEKMREAIDAWNSYGSYRIADLFTFLPALVIVVGYEWGPLIDDKHQPLVVFLWCDLAFHLVRVITTLVLFLRSTHRVADFEATRNKYVRRIWHRVQVTTHFLFVVIAGSYLVHHAPKKNIGLYRCALYDVIVTSIVELYFFVDPAFNASVKAMWDTAESNSYVALVRAEAVTSTQINFYREKLAGACKFYARQQPLCTRMFRRSAFMLMACVETALMMLYWNTGLCVSSRGPSFKVWILVDVVLHAVFAFLPMPHNPPLDPVNDNASVLQNNPMVPLHRALLFRVIHFSWAFWGAIILSWFSTCTEQAVFECGIASVVVTMVLEVRGLMRLWLEYDHAVYLYYLWVMGSPILSSSLVHWAMSQNHSVSSNQLNLQSQPQAPLAAAATTNNSDNTNDNNNQNNNDSNDGNTNHCCEGHSNTNSTSMMISNNITVTTTTTTTAPPPTTMAVVDIADVDL